MNELLDDEVQNPFEEVPIEITVSVGHSRPTVRELLDLTHDTVLTLDRGVEDPVDLFVGEKLIARGELRESDDGNALLVRVTDVISPERPT